eukprot:GEMP01065624.1.p1 GENE.GEMP01065624.1~~GEMP01065624.1.p1  ORF type:complete len:194 (+),score=47.54 GEMP01065624.1:134-715(+)
MQPRTREERHQFRHKENIEKERLKARTGNFYRYEEVENPLRVMEDCPSYLDGRDRMVSGGEQIAERNLQDREEEQTREIDSIETKRDVRLKREENRWKCIDEKELNDVERLRRLQADPMVGKKNVSGQPFNIVNSTYDATPEGQDLKYRDMMVKYRGDLRSVNLAVKGHLGFNPITGEQTYVMNKPDAPERPT